MSSELPVAPRVPSLTSYGFTNCQAWNDAILTVFKVTDGNGNADHPMQLPKTTAFDGMKVYGYWSGIDSNEAGGMTFTNYVRAIIGQEGFTNYYL